MRSIVQVLFFSIFLAAVNLSAQVVTFFDESSDPGYYDTGLAFVGGGSSFSRTGPSGDKIPVYSGPLAYRGDDALSFTWTSHPGGNWDALVIAPGFIFQDITQSDSLSFWVYSETGLASSALPRISMEGAPGTTKSLQYSLSAFSADLPAQSWQRITIPLDLFFNDPNQTNIQFNQIKAIIFSQDQADQTEHTLLIDEVKTVPAGSAPLPAPANFAGDGYERHGELRWSAVSAPNLDGYHLYRSSDGGQTFSLVSYFPGTDTLVHDFWGDPGTSLERHYYLTAVGVGGEESPTTDTLVLTGAPMTDEEFLDMVQRATFRYFWDFAHPVSGLARERNTSLNTVTMGGSGFGVMAIVAGIERGYITREQGRDRLLQITEFLGNADRFHGAWPHWMNGNTGQVIPFSAQDDGGDLVETAFLVQGLLAVRSYFDENSTADSLLRARITNLWETVEWDWYRQINQPVLYWHWSPNFAWAMNFPLYGFNEVHIVYILAIASPTHGVPASLYHTGWAGSNYVNPNSWFGYEQYTGPNRGGPLFFAHYSYLGFDPRNKADDYANYFVRNAHHTLINRAWCINNPGNYVGYGPDSWGLTASDDPLVGYLAHEPTPSRDNGTIAPTAALSSMPYTPTESMAALKHFYRNYGEDLWGPMGFYDAFNPTENWFADSYLAIDQGPIVVMLENYRSGLFWDLFMDNPEIQPALDAIGFTSDSTSITDLDASSHLPWRIYPNPNAGRMISIESPLTQPAATLTLWSAEGRLMQTTDIDLWAGQTQGHRLPALSAGIYHLSIHHQGRSLWQQRLVITQ